MNFDMQSFYEEFLNKIRDDQLRYDANHPADTGALADVVPFDGIGGNPGCPVWQVAYIVIARQLWKHYGEDALPSLRAHYAGLVELMGWFDRHADPSDGLLMTHCYGDWMGFHPASGNGGSSPMTPPPAVTAFYHVLAKRYLAEIATATGHSADAAAYTRGYTHGQAAYHARFYSEMAGGYSPCALGTNCYGTSKHGSQASNSMALMLGAPPDAATAAKVAKNLMEDVVGFRNKTTTGVAGIAWLFPALDQAGYSSTGLALLANDEYPSLGHMAHQNMTTLCENWACTFHDAGGGSQNHIMLGGFDAWVLASIGGLDSVVNGTTGGWRHIVGRVAPAAITTLKGASYNKMTRYGEVKFGWRYDGASKKLSTNVTVPVGAELTLHTPQALDGSECSGSACALARLVEVGVGTGAASEHGQPTLVWAAGGGNGGTLPSGISLVEATSAAVLAHLGSGTYRFEASFD
jgi:hypothetical protein